MRLCESSVDTTRLYFHGKTGIEPIREILPPKPFKPFFVSDNLDYALLYAEYAPLKHYASHVDPEIILVKLNPSANVFDPTNSSDMMRLESLDFWSDGVIDRLKSGADIFMVMEWASKDSELHPNDSKMGKMLHGTGTHTHRDEFCKQLKMLGYDMFKTSEEVENISSNLVYGIFDKNGFESFYPEIIDIETAKHVNEMIKRGSSNHRIINYIRRNNQNEILREIRP